jgi:hypothetical protein
MWKLYQIISSSTVAYNVVLKRTFEFKTYYDIFCFVYEKFISYIPFKCFLW